MQYNKYAIALVLLASSAFASSLASTNLQEFADEIAAFMNTDNKSDPEEISKLTDPVKGKLTEGLVTKLKAMKLKNIKDSAEVKAVLDQYVAEEAEAARVKAAEEEAEAARVKAAEEEAETIFGKIQDGKLSSVEEGNLGNLKEKKAEIATYEADMLYRPFTKDDIVKRLLNPAYLPEKFANASQKLKFLAGENKISSIDIDKHPGLIGKPQFDAINAVETALEKPLTEVELNDYLTNKNFKALDVAVKVTVLSKLSAASKVGDYEKILEFVDEKQLKNIKAEETTEKILPEKLAEILKPKENPTNAANSKQETTSDPKNAATKTPEEEAEAAKAAKETEAEEARVKAAKATKEAEAAKLKDTEAAKTKEAGAKADKVLKVLKDKKFSELSNDEITGLKLTAAEIEALKKADVTKDSEISVISEILSNVKEPVGSTAEVADTPFYKTTWFISISAVLVLGAIGGGAYMMTRKTEETDL